MVHQIGTINLTISTPSGVQRQVVADAIGEALWNIGLTVRFPEGFQQRLYPGALQRTMLSELRDTPILINLEDPPEVTE